MSSRSRSVVKDELRAVLEQIAVLRAMREDYRALRLTAERLVAELEWLRTKRWDLI